MKNRIIEVYHANVLVAKVKTCLVEDWAALEYAFRWTQNIEGSWSIKNGNPDNNQRVEVMTPLPVDNGKTFGLRSSMMSDHFVVDGKKYVCAMCGFKEV